MLKRFLKLKPGSAYGKRLMAALQSYSKTPAARRRYRCEKGRLQPMPEISFLRQWVVLGVLVGVLSFLSVTYYVRIYQKSGNQTLAVHVDDEWLREQGGQLTLVVDGNDHTITAPSRTGDLLTVTVSFGEHTFSVKHGDTVVHDPQSFDIEKDGRKVLRITASDIRLENGVPSPITSREGMASRNSQPAAISSLPASDTKTDANSDWVSLFDGTNVSRWSTLGAFTLKNRLLITNGGRAHAVSRDEYSDFELEAEWKISSVTNGGIFYRDIPGDGSELFCGNEFQLTAHTDTEDRDAKYSGSLYGVINANEAVTRLLGTSPTVGLWNTARIVCRGTSVEHWLNGQKVVSFDTESAEWEFACRAGTSSKFWCGYSEDLLLEVAWFQGNNPNGIPSDVGKLRPNPFGLYNMHGNVWEWVHDCWRADTYKDWTGPAAVDPRVDTAPEDRRVMRGGDYFLSAEEARSACRDGYPHDHTFYDVGFRVALSVDAVRQMQTREQAK